VYSKQSTLIIKDESITTIPMLIKPLIDMSDVDSTTTMSNDSQTTAQQAMSVPVAAGSCTGTNSSLCNAVKKLLPLFRRKW
jgi:hypothetical protein